MIVHEHNCGGGDADGGAEDFARVDEEGVQRAGGDQFMAHDAAARVETENHKAFHARFKIGMGAGLLAPVAGALFRVVEHGAIGGEFAESNHLEFHRDEFAMFPGWWVAGEEFHIIS